MFLKYGLAAISRKHRENWRPEPLLRWNFRNLFNIIPITVTERSGISEANEMLTHSPHRRLERQIEHSKLQLSWPPVPPIISIDGRSAQRSAYRSPEKLKF